MFDTLVEASTIAVGEIVGKDDVQVTLIENDKPVKAFFAHRTDPEFSKRIDFRRTHACFYRRDSFDFENGVEDRCVLTVAIMD